MTTFTPPTEFPHKCQTISGHKITLLAVDTNGFYACLLHGSKGQKNADIREHSTLRDIPKFTNTWQNVYPNGFSPRVCSSRSEADRCAVRNRIGVLRIDKIDGVTTPTLEDV